MKKSRPPTQMKKHKQETSADSPRTEIKYVDPNRDRNLGNADRTGRHFDELPDDSDDVEAD